MRSSGPAAVKAKMMDVAVPPTPDPDEAAKTIKCEVDGDKATCTAEGMKEPLKLVKKGGKWLIVPDLAPEAERKDVLGPISLMVKAIDKVQGRIGQSGVTAEQIFKDFVQAMADAMGAGATEQRPATGRANRPVGVLRCLDVLHGGRATGSHRGAPPAAHCDLGTDLNRRLPSASVLAVAPGSSTST